VSGWAIAASLWLASAVWSSRNYERRQRLAREVDADDLFRQALSEYLQGSFLAAENTLGRSLKHHPQDVEARLLLATLLRHTKRHDEARRELARLAQLEGAARWATEIEAERDKLTSVHPWVANLFQAPSVNESASSRVSRAA
jgi:Tfp pilus assembly protein PilF